MLNRGIMTTLAKYNLVDKFVMSDRHTSGAGAVFKRYYLIVYFGVNLHIEFTDEDDNRKSYCKGVVIVLTGEWSEGDSLIFKMRIQWDSVWRDN